MSEPKDTNGYIAESISFDADAKKSNKNTVELKLFFQKWGQSSPIRAPFSS